MKMPSRALAALLLLGLAAPVPAGAQTASPAGQWACQFAYTEFDRFGNRTSGHVQEYGLAVHANGSFDVSGNTIGGIGATPFQGNGQWTDRQGYFHAQGQIIEQGPFGTMPMMFMVIATFTPDGAGMSSTNETRDPTNSYLMARANTLCQRR